MDLDTNNYNYSEVDDTRLPSIDFSEINTESENILTGGNDMQQDINSYEKEFHQIYNKALAYSDRLKNIERKMEGGQNDDTNPDYQDQVELPDTYKTYDESINYGIYGIGGELKNPTIKLMLELSKIMNESKKYPELKWPQFMSVSKKIIDDIKDKTGKTDMQDIRTQAIAAAKNPEKYVAEYKKSEKNRPEKIKAKSNIRFEPKSNSRFDDEDDDEEEARNSDIDLLTERMNKISSNSRNRSRRQLH